MNTTYKLVITLFTCFAFLIGSSQSNEWISIGKFNDTDYYLRLNKTNYDGTKKVWIKSVSKNLESVSKTGKKVSLPNGYRLMLQEYNCSDRQTRMLSLTDYNSNGDVFSSHKFESYEIEWVDVLPDSVGEILLNKVCKLFNSSSSDL